MKYETAGVAIEEFVGLKRKIYSFLADTFFCQAIKILGVSFALVRTAFFIFYFSLYKMFDSNTLKISIETIIKNPEMLRFVPDHFKTRKVCKNVKVYS